MKNVHGSAAEVRGLDAELVEALHEGDAVDIGKEVESAFASILEKCDLRIGLLEGSVTLRARWFGCATRAVIR